MSSFQFVGAQLLSGCRLVGVDPLGFCAKGDVAVFGPLDVEP